MTIEVLPCLSRVSVESALFLRIERTTETTTQESLEVIRPGPYSGTLSMHYGLSLRRTTQRTMCLLHDQISHLFCRQDSYFSCSKIERC